ncbi:hypothetical protein Y032_0046g1345 [Ancylostoma ceylanicum]|uniref:Uncharacterized protein n=1 Tax=Ancylostoma ceylanicum TaxID=53326 RepID=A0A016UBH0_9BILA|nr:hypothetical protein Y032_0046g1345 [Ancylostoma ceylanicum]
MFGFTMSVDGAGEFADLSVCSSATAPRAGSATFYWRKTCKYVEEALNKPITTMATSFYCYSRTRRGCAAANSILQIHQLHRRPLD